MKVYIYNLTNYKVDCWPRCVQGNMLPNSRFAGSKPVEVDGFSGRKIISTSPPEGTLGCRSRV